MSDVLKVLQRDVDAAKLAAQEAEKKLNTERTRQRITQWIAFTARRSELLPAIMKFPIRDTLQSKITLMKDGKFYIDNNMSDDDDSALIAELAESGELPSEGECVDDCTERHAPYVADALGLDPYSSLVMLACGPMRYEEIIVGDTQGLDLLSTNDCSCPGFWQFLATLRELYDLDRANFYKLRKYVLFVMDLYQVGYDSFGGGLYKVLEAPIPNVPMSDLFFYSRGGFARMLRTEVGNNDDDADDRYESDKVGDAIPQFNWGSQLNKYHIARTALIEQHHEAIEERLYDNLMTPEEREAGGFLESIYGIVDVDPDQTERRVAQLRDTERIERAPAYLKRTAAFDARYQARNAELKAKYAVWAEEEKKKKDAERESIARTTTGWGLTPERARLLGQA